MLVGRFVGAVLTVAVVIIGNTLALDNNRTEEFQRTFNQRDCVTRSGFSGLCMTRVNCNRNGGIESGSCGLSGICCETNIQCGQKSSLKRILIQTPPLQNLPTRCAYTIERYSPNVCQIKIEMEELRLAQPQEMVDSSLDCTELFEVNNMILCGNNDGQHLYIPFDAAASKDASVNLVLGNGGSLARWRLIVTQIECPVKSKANTNDLQILAPVGCTQYFTERTGTFESFNYNSGIGTYMTNLKYAICFQRQVGDSAIEFTFVDITLPNHGVSNGYDIDCHPLITTVGKENDYLMIPGAVVRDWLQPTYFCGTDKVGTNVTYAAAGPFAIYFNSDQEWGAQNLGFQMTYRIV